jgi:hypothetical protein
MRAFKKFRHRSGSANNEITFRECAASCARHPTAAMNAAGTETHGITWLHTCRHCWNRVSPQNFPHGSQSRPGACCSPAHTARGRAGFEMRRPACVGSSAGCGT